MKNENLSARSGAKITFTSKENSRLIHSKQESRVSFPTIETKYLSPPSYMAPTNDNFQIRSDSSFLSQNTFQLNSFLGKMECDFLSEIKIFSCEQLASTDVDQIANKLYKWYNSEDAGKTNFSDVKISSVTNDYSLEKSKIVGTSLSSCQVQVHSWYFEMNKRCEIGRGALRLSNVKCIGGSSLHCNSKVSPTKIKEGTLTNKDLKRKIAPIFSEENSNKLHRSFLKDKNLDSIRLINENDLSTVLPKEDSEFLSQFWIFSVRQLQATLNILKQNPTKGEYVDLVNEIINHNNLKRNDLRKKKEPKQFESMSSYQHDLNPLPSFEEAQAREKLQTWENAISNCAHQTCPKQKQFSLSGPLQIFLPDWLKYFLLSFKITAVNEFLNSNILESSPLVIAICQWRAIRNMAPLQASFCACYLLGIASRFQIAINSIPYASKLHQAWTKSALVVLNDNSKDFLLSQGITSSSQLLQAKTEDVANDFVTWRRRQGMLPLRGSGPVDIVSAWKDSTKDVMEAEKMSNPVSFYEISTQSYNYSDQLFECSEQLEMNKCIELDDRKYFYKNSEVGTNSFPHTPYSTNQTLHHRREAQCIPQNKQNINAHPLKHVLKSSILRFLSSVGIYTAKDLYKSDKRECSKTVKAMIKFRAENGLTTIRPSSCVRLLYDWAHAANTYKTKKEKVKPAGKPHHEKVTNLEMDPLKILSKASRDFLQSQGITNAAQFLSVKSSSLTTPYISWRATKGMNALKGCGAIATISGWKSSVKDASKKQGFKDLDLTKLSEVYVLPSEEHTVNVSYSRQIQEGYHHNKLKSISNSTSLLLGLPHVKITVVNQSEDTLYDFKLIAHNIRKQANGSEIYLTYLGAKVLKDKHSPIESDQLSDSSWRNPSTSNFCTIMSDMTNTFKESKKSFEVVNHETFSTLNEGCGFINLGTYNPFPMTVEVDGKKSHVFNALKSFILSSSFDISLTFKSSKSSEMPTQNDANILVCQEQDFSKFSFYISQQMESGQTIKLDTKELIDRDSAEDVKNLYNEKKNIDIYLRTVISRIISTMSLNEIDAAAKFLKEDVLSSIISSMKSNKNTYAEYSANPGLVSLSNSLISRRRLHWVAELLTTQLKVILRHKEEYSEENASLLMDSLSNVMFNQSTRQYISNVQSNNSEFYKAMVEEVMNEILYAMSSTVTSLPPFGDQSSWCKISSDFALQVVTKAAEYVLSDQYDTDEAYIKLRRQITSLTKTTVSLVNKYCIELNQNPVSSISLLATQALSLPPSHVEHVTSQRFSSFKMIEDIEILTQSTESLLKNKATISLFIDFEAYKEIVELCDGSFHLNISSFSTSISTEDIVVVEKPPHMLKKNISEKSRNFVTRGVSSVLNGVAKVNKNWYLSNQLFLILDLFAKSFVTRKWTRAKKNEITEPIFSIESFLGTTTITNPAIVKKPFHKEQLIHDLRTVPHLNSFLLSLKQSEFSFKPLKNLFPSTLPLFIFFLWPVLRTRGWTLESARPCGPSLNLVKFSPPPVASEKISRNQSRIAVINDNMVPSKSDKSRRTRFSCEQIQLEMERIFPGHKHEHETFPLALKRIIISDFYNIMQSPELMNVKSNGSKDLSYVSVKKVLDLYVKARSSDMTEREVSNVNAIAKCFLTFFQNTLLVVLLYNIEKSQVQHYVDIKNFAELFGPEYLLRMLFILPIALENIGIPQDEKEQTMQYAQDIVTFLCESCEMIFDKNYIKFFKQYPTKDLSFDEYDYDDENESKKMEGVAVNEQGYFQGHVEVMRYIGKTICSNERGVIATAYHEYYSCIAHGSVIKTHEDIPINRGAEWLLKDFQQKQCKGCNGKSLRRCKITT